VTRGFAVLGVFFRCRPSRASLGLAVVVACKSSQSVPLDHRASDPPCPAGPPGCSVDTDCAEGGVCICGAPADDAAVTVAIPNSCVGGGNCRLDSDCTSVHYCSPSSTGCSIATSYFCHTSGDDCDNDADCRVGDFCQYVPSDAKWSCVSGTSCD
jgi:hypothetical protein